VRIATFNANSIRSRMDVILGWLAANQPDVLCVQETKVQDAEFPREPIEAAGWCVTFRGEKAYNGVALISKKTLSDVAFGLDDAPHDETRLACARLGKLAVVTTYVPQGRELDHPMFQYKLQWFGRLRQWFDRRFRPDDLLVWTGDLNVAAEPMDVHRPEDYADHVCFHADVRKAFADCRAWGFVDVFRQFHPGPGLYTFFDYRTPNAAQRGIGWRLDYILASPMLARKATDGAIDMKPRLAPKPSDHTFVFADFDL
jgi:exodeoxyribonuclease III